MSKCLDLKSVNKWRQNEEFCDGFSEWGGVSILEGQSVAAGRVVRIRILFEGQCVTALRGEGGGV